MVAAYIFAHIYCSTPVYVYPEIQIFGSPCFLIFLPKNLFLSDISPFCSYLLRRILALFTIEDKCQNGNINIQPIQIKLDFFRIESK